MKVTVKFQTDENQANALRALAQRADLSVAQYLRKLVRVHLEANAVEQPDIFQPLPKKPRHKKT